MKVHRTIEEKLSLKKNILFDSIVQKHLSLKNAVQAHFLILKNSLDQ
jgi:hypothetical protein